MECGEEVSCGLLIARGDAPEVFDRVEKTLHQVALPVEGKVAVPLDDAIFLGGITAVMARTCRLARKASLS